MHVALRQLWPARHLATAAAAVASLRSSSIAAMPGPARVYSALSATSRRIAYNHRCQSAITAYAADRKQILLMPTPRPLLPAEDAFYAESISSFEELGVNKALTDSLEAAGFVKPSRVQELAVPHIISGRDVVLAAETGSGKTLAYIAPVASLLLQRAAAAAAAAGAAGAGDDTKRPHKQLALVLCPNTALCQQVIRLVNSLTSPTSNKPLLKACQVSSTNPPPFEPPDIVVTTPGALVTLFNDRGYNYGHQWSADGVSRRAMFVIVDEADLLCQGGYEKDLKRLLDAFKAGERRFIERQVTAELNMPEDQFSKLSRHMKQACWEGGVPAMIKAGYRLSSSSSQLQQQQQGPDVAQHPSSSSSSSSNEQDKQQQASSSSIEQQYGPYFKRQYLFVAATMPAMTKADVGTELQQRLKDAVWVSGDLLHQIKPHIDHTWVPLRNNTEDGAAVCEELVGGLNSDVDFQAGRASVLVFARNTKNADKYSHYLTQHGMSNILYHKDVPKDDRDAALATMAAADGSSSSSDGGSSSRGNVVMVCTDAASRGLDLPNITHVIQADFAMTAIEFLHRVGRTARAGRDGKVTSFYGPSDRILAEAIKQYVAEGRPIEECFSRNRSFSSKVKKYGKFVPRGQEGQQKATQQR